MQDAFFSPLIEQAIELAAEWHAGTFRKGRWRAPTFHGPNGAIPKIPAMAHVSMVALTVQRAGWGAVEVAAAYLHDILEDPNQLGQTMKFTTLSQHMGLEVAQLVNAVSEVKKNEHGVPQKWQARKIGYIEGLKKHPVEAAAISLADKIHNLWSMNETLINGIDVFESTDQRKGLSAGPELQRWFYQSVYAATLHHKDPRIIPMQARLRIEIDRFDEIAFSLASS